MTLEQRAKLLRQNPSALSIAADPSDTRTNEQKILDRLGAGGYSALNSVLMGLPDYLVKTASADSYKYLKELREKNQDAANIGDIAGTIGSMFIPGGAIVKGLGAGAKAIGAVGAADKLAKAGKFLGGTELTGNLLSKIGQGGLRGAGQAAEQAIPRALTGLGVAETDEDRQAALLGVPLSVGVGGLGGAVLGPLASKLLGKTKIAGKEFGESTPEFLANEAREVLDKATLQQAGIETRALRLAARGAGFGNPRVAATKGQDYVNELAAGLRERGIRGKKNFEALVDKNRKAWDEIDEAFQKNAPKNWSEQFSNRLATDDDLLQLVDEQGTEAATKAFTDIAAKIAKDSNLPALKNRLGNMVRSGMNAIDPDEKARGFVANQIRKKLDDYVADASGLDVTDAKADYKLLQPFMQQEGRDTFKLTKAGAGSPTFEKATVGALIGGGTQSGIGSEQGFDPGKALTGLAGGALLGGAANKLLPAILNKGSAELGRLGGGILANPTAQKLLEKGIQQAPNALVKEGSIVAGKAAKVPAAKSADPEQSTAEKEAALPQDQVAPARQEFSQKFAKTLNSKLETIYQQYYSDVDPQEFLQKVAEKTDGFQDMRKVAGILYQNPKEKDAFLRKYDAFLALKNVDIDKALKGGGLLDLDDSGKKGRDILVDAMLNLQTEGDTGKRTKEQERIVKERIDQAKDNPQLLAQMLKDYGLDFADLADLGLA
jgi:hypothetical protein